MLSHPCQSWALGTLSALTSQSTSCLSWKDAHLFFFFPLYRFAFGSTKQTRRNAIQKAQSNTIDLVGHNAKYGGASALIGGALLNCSSSSSLWCG